MKVADIQTAYSLLAKRADLQSRLGQVSGAQTISEMAMALIGSGLEDGILQQARTNVADFLNKAIGDLNTQLTALGVELT